MQWEFVVALVIAIPIILVPVVFAWYLNIGGLFKAVQRRKAKIAHGKEAQAIEAE